MQLRLFDTLCKLAHQKHDSQLLLPMLKILILIERLQLLALLLPYNGWGLWNYSDGHLGLLQVIASCALFTPILQSSNIPVLFELFSMLALLMSIISIIGLAILTNSKVQNKQLSLVVFYYLLLSTQILQLPYLSLFIGQLTCGVNSLSSICMSPYNMFIGLLGCILTVFINVSAMYFLRTYSFQPFCKLQVKFTYIGFINLLLNIIIIALHHLEDTSSNSYLKLAAIHINMILLMRESLFYPPYTYKLNRFNWEVLCAIEGCCVVVTISVVSGNLYIVEGSLIAFLMLITSLSIGVGSIIYRRKQLNVLNYVMTSTTCIYFTQALYELNGIDAHFYYKSHQLICDRNCRQVNKKNAIKPVKSMKSVIFCILSAQLEQAKLGNEYEELELCLISFLGQHCKKPLLGLVELKRYEIQSTSQTYYFKCMRKYIAEQLQSSIQATHHKLSNERSMDLQQINRSTTLSKQYIPRMMEIMDGKIDLWTSQIKGFNTLYDLERVAISLSEVIQNIGIQLENDIQIDFTKLDHLSNQHNVIELKIVSIYFSAVLNDYQNSSLCELTIQEILTMEHSYASEIISNLQIIDDKVALLMVSMVKSRGQILNQDRKGIAQYFGYDDTEFQQITSVNQLVPQFMQNGVHDSLLSGFIQSGYCKLFNSFNPVHGISRDGFIVAQQIKLDHNFQMTEDYVLMGCLSKIKQSQECIIFGEDGKLWGLTKGIYDDLLLQYDDKFTLSRAMQVYIYMLFPHIFKLMEILRDTLNSKADIFNNEENTILYAPKNIRDILIMHTNQNITQPGRSQHDKQWASYNSSRLRSDVSQSTNKQLYDQFNEVTQVMSADNNINSVLLFNPLYVEQVNKFIELCQGCEHVKYQVKYTLQYKEVDILEMRRRDMFGQTDSTLNFNTTVSLHNTKNISQSNRTSGLSQMNDQPIKEVTPKLVNKQYSLTHLERRYNPLKQQEQLQQSDAQINNQASVSYGPLSQRVHFISPTSKQEQLEDLLDQEFNELQMQMESNRVREEIEILEESAKNEQVSSDKVKDNSNNLLDLLKFNKQKGNQFKQELEIEVQKSKSSVTSGTSGVSAIQVIRKFHQSTRMIQSLQMVVFINVFILSLVIILMSIHIVIADTNTTQVLSKIDDINGPMRFNRFFCDLFASSWSLLYNSFTIVDSSDYIVNRTLQQVTYRSELMQTNLGEIYPIFIGVENRGLLQLINLDYLYQDSELVQYTYFQTFIQNIAVELFTANEFGVYNISKLASIEYTDALLTLRYNLKNVVLMNQELIESLNVIFFQLTQDMVTSMETQVILEVICIALIFSFQVAFWRNIEIYAQQLLLLLGRLQESHAIDMITRMTFIKETLHLFGGKQSWKQQNFCQLTYLPLNTLGVEKMQSQSKVLKDFSYKMQNRRQQDDQDNEQHQQKKGTRRKNLNVVLNSRVYRTQISVIIIMTIIVIAFLAFALYLIGGYLLYQQQATQLLPSQQILVNYIRFISQLDIVVTCAFIMKTQPLMYSTLVQQGVYSQSVIDSFKDQRKIFKIFLEYQSTFANNMTSIYGYVLESQKIIDSDKDILFKVYQDDFCILLSKVLPYCGNTSLYYGKAYLVDDNKEYLSTGIVGVISRLDTIFKSTYQYEINNIDYEPDQSILLQQINSKEFTNAFIEHFMDTNEGTNLFLTTIQQSTNDIIRTDLQSITLYFLALGIILCILYPIVYVTWIYKTNQRLIKLRLSLINLPIDILTEQHTLSLLKRMK